MRIVYVSECLYGMCVYSMYVYIHVCVCTVYMHYVCVACLNVLIVCVFCVHGLSTCAVCMCVFCACAVCTRVICVCCVYACVSHSFTDSSGAAGQSKDDLWQASGWVQTLSRVWVALICLVLLMPVFDSTYVCQEPPGNVPCAVMARGQAWSPPALPSGTVNGRE